MCRNWEQYGQCARGENCHFAHGKEELRESQEEKNPDRKNHSNPVNSIPLNPYGPGFFPMAQANYKTVLCKYSGTDKCKFGDQCHFAHGKEELRKPPNNAQNQKIKQYQMIAAQYQQQYFQRNMITANQYVKQQTQFKEYLAILDPIKNEKIKQLIAKGKEYLEKFNFHECLNTINQIVLPENNGEKISEEDENIIQSLKTLIDKQTSAQRKQQQEQQRRQFQAYSQQFFQF